MEERQLGSLGLKVSALGLGCMGMSEFYGQSEAGEAVRVINRALDLGVNSSVCEISCRLQAYHCDVPILSSSESIARSALFDDT